MAYARQADDARTEGREEDGNGGAEDASRYGGRCPWAIAGHDREVWTVGLEELLRDEDEDEDDDDVDEIRRAQGALACERSMLSRSVFLAVAVMTATILDGVTDAVPGLVHERASPTPCGSSVP